MHHQTIRTFVRREGRMTKSQARALKELLPVYSIQVSDDILNFDKIFGRQAKTILEIGFGMGDSLIEMAMAEPATNFIGIEVHRPGIGACLNGIHDNVLKNVRIITEDAITILQKNITDQSLDAIYIYFPDPWPKKRHHKRRMIQYEFVRLLQAKLKSDGILHLATDWQPYAEWMMTILLADKGFKNLAGIDKFSQRPAWRPETKFERRGKKLGHEVYDLVFQKKRHPIINA